MNNILVGGQKSPGWSPRALWPYLAGFCLSLCAAARAQQTVTLGWDPDTDPTVVGYVLYYGTASQQYTIRLDVGTNTTFTVSSLSLGSNYFFAVTSYYPDGVESAASPEVSVGVPPSLFFTSQTPVTSQTSVPNSNDTIADFLQFPDGIDFGYYTIVSFPWFYHQDMGYEYLFEANDGNEGVFLYDLNSDSFWYTSPEIFPIMYDFSLNDWLFYYPDDKNPGHYTSSPRYFYNFTTKKIFSK